MSSPNPANVEDLSSLLRAANHRWLKASEILLLLQNWQHLEALGVPLQTKPPDKPFSGSLFLFNKTVVPRYRADGYNWAKRKGGRGVRENHERLKIDGVAVLNCFYTRSQDKTDFNRRAYSLLPGNYLPSSSVLSNLVLVHYLDEGLASRAKPLSSTTIVAPPMHHLLYSERTPSLLQFSPPSSSKQTPPEEALSPTTDEPPFSPTLFYTPISDLALTDSPCSTPASPGSLPSSSTDTSAEDTMEIEPLPAADSLSITDYSPEWDYIEGGAKVLVTGAGFHPGEQYVCYFGGVAVAAEVVQPGVLRCKAPPHSAGPVPLVVAGERAQAIPVPFEYRTRHEPAGADWLALNEHEFKLRVLERLEQLERRVGAKRRRADFVLDTLRGDGEQGEAEDEEERRLERLVESLLALVTDQAREVNEVDRHGLALLHYLAALGYADVLRWLLRLGDGLVVDVRDAEGRSPLHWAVRHGHIKVVRLLVEKGRANPWLPALDGTTPVDIARRHAHKAILSYLLHAKQPAPPYEPRESREHAQVPESKHEALLARMVSLMSLSREHECADRRAHTGSGGPCDTTNMLAAAATVIQSAYRGHRVRLYLKKERQAALKIQLAFRYRRQRFLKSVEKAARKIQAAYRKFKVAKEESRAAQRNLEYAAAMAASCYTTAL